MKKIIFMCCLFLLLINIIGCQEDAKVESITVSAPVSVCEVSDEVRFTAVVLPENAVNKNVTWSVSPVGATISALGTFKPNTAGTYTVTATSVAIPEISGLATIEVTIPDEHITAVIDQFLSLGLNYTLNYETYAFSSYLQVTEYGLFNGAYNDEAGSLVRSYENKFYASRISAEIFFDISVPEVTYDQYQSFFDFYYWFEGNTRDLAHLGTYNEEFNTVYYPVLGGVNNDGVFIYDYTSLADYLLYLSVDVELEPEVGGIEIQLDAENKITKIVGIARSDAPEFYCLPSTALNGENIVFSLNYTNIGWTSIPEAKAFFESNQGPTYGQKNTWATIFNEIYLDLLDTVSQSEATEFVTFLSEATFQQDNEVDYDLTYEPNGTHYFIHITLNLFNFPYESALLIEERYQNIRVGFSSDYAHRLRDTPSEIHVGEIYSQEYQSFLINFFLERTITFSNVKAQVEEWLAPNYSGLTIPLFEGAPSYRFINLSSFGIIAIEAYFHYGTDISKHPQFPTSSYVDYWSLRLSLAGWTNVKTSEGLQRQDPSGKVAIVFTEQEFSAGFPVIWIDFVAALPALGAAWPSALLGPELDALLPHISVKSNGGYSYELKENSTVTSLLIISPTLSFLQIVPLFIDLGWEKVFNDPYGGSVMSFISPDHQYQCSVRFNDLETYPFNNPEQTTTFTVYAYNPGNQDFVNYPIYIEDDEWSLDLLEPYMGQDALLMPTWPSANPLQYQLFEASYALGLYLYTGISKERAHGYYVSGYTAAEAAAFLAWFQANHYLDYLDGAEADIYYVKEDSLEFSYAHLGMGYKLIYFNDGSFLVLGVRVSTYFNDFGEAFQGLYDLKDAESGQFSAAIEALLAVFPSISNLDFEHIELLVTGEIYDWTRYAFEMDILGITNEQVALDFAESLFEDTGLAWRVATVQLPTAEWVITRYISLNSYRWFKVTVAYFVGNNMTVLITVQ